MTDTEQDEIDAAWAEATGEYPAQQDEAAEDTAADDADSEAGAADTTQDEAAPQPPNTDPETTPTVDIWANASPEQKAAFEAAEQARQRLEHTVRSNDGRVSRYQRERDEALKKLRAVNSVAEHEDLEAYLASDEWTKVRSEYADDLNPVFKALETLAARDKIFSERFSQLDEVQAVQTADSHEDWLDKEAPDRAELFGSANFLPWLETQSSGVREMAQRNWNGVVEPAEVKAICDLFRPKSGLGVQSDPQPKVIDRKREVQLQGARSVTSRTPILTGPDANDEDAAWNEAVAAIEKERALARR